MQGTTAYSRSYAGTFHIWESIIPEGWMANTKTSVPYLLDVEQIDQDISWEADSHSVMEPKGS